MVAEQKNNKSIICSICEGKYAFGVATLINSAISNGFQGTFYILIRDKLPFWVNNLKKKENTFILNDHCSIKFESIKWDYHLSYYKPYFLEKLMSKNPSANVFYFDPDITIECDWNFFLDWVEIGPALCTDGNYPTLGRKHPWVASWKHIFDIKTDVINSEIIPYVNSGFIGLNFSQINMVKTWIKFTNLLIEKGHNLKNFGPTRIKYKQKRAFSICGDQDILNAVLISNNFGISLFGVDGMGFNGSSYLMFHNIGKKTWDKNFIRDFLTTGTRISSADTSYLKYLRGTIKPYSNSKLMLSKVNVAITKLLQRIL